MTDKELLIGSMIFSLLSLIDPKYKGAKRGRKAITRTIKREMKIAASKNEAHCKKVVWDGRFLLDNARDQLVEEMGEDAKYIDPGMFIKIIQKRYPEYLEIYDLQDSHVQELSDHYGASGLTMSSIKFANRLIDHVVEELSNDKDNIIRKENKRE